MGWWVKKYWLEFWKEKRLINTAEKIKIRKLYYFALVSGPVPEESELKALKVVHLKEKGGPSFKDRLS